MIHDTDEEEGGLCIEDEKHEGGGYYRSMEIIHDTWGEGW